MNENFFIETFNSFPNMAFLLSIIFNTIIAILGVVPSVFVTMGNIIFFGITKGLIISIIGEAIGAVVSFWLYRKGFRGMSQKTLQKHRYLNQIINANANQAMKLIFLCRFFPYVPSGFVTYAAAIGKIDIIRFSIVSTLGKIPSLFIEVIFSLFVIDSLAEVSVSIIIGVVSLVLIAFVINKILKENNGKN